MQRGLKLESKLHKAQALTLLDTKFVVPKALGLRRVAHVSCEDPSLDVHVTDAARHCLGMAPQPFAKRETGGVQGPPPAVFTDDESGAIRVLHREIRLRFAAALSDRKRRALLKAHGLKRVGGLRDDDVHDIWTVKSKSADVHGAALLDVCTRLNEDDSVLWCTPNFVSSFERQMLGLAPPVPAAAWHLQQISAPQAWALSLGYRTVVAVIDDGIDVDHPNLKSRMKLRPDPSEPRDRFGRDFFADDHTLEHFDPRPKAFMQPFNELAGNDLHGTACAGLVGAEGNPLSGAHPAVGVAPRTRLLAVKIFHGGRFVPDAKVAAGLRYAGRFAHILSCSWTCARNAEIDDAITVAATSGRSGRGCPVVVATGNQGASLLAYPASHPLTIAVGAITEDEKETTYANHGDGLDCCAPSTGGPRAIYTTDWSADDRGLNLAKGLPGGHTAAFEGTSAACPQVSGTIALMLSRKPSLSLDAIRTILRSTTDRVGFGTTPDGEPHRVFGYGRINAFAATLAAIQA